jgi:hypothetical protein
MKTIVKGLIRDEKGASLVLVLILLLIGGLIIGPLLSYMGTGLITGQVYEMRTDELYAADAGVEDAIWKIQNCDGYLPCSPGSPARNYTITDADGGVAEVNDKSVEVTITCEYSDEDGLTYRVLSTATGDGSGTTIEAYLDVLYMDFSSFLDNAIVSDNSIIIHNNVDVTGNVTSGGSVTTPGGDHDDVDGTVTENAELDWPSSAALSAYYLNQVGGAVHYDGDTDLDLDGNSCPPGPIYKTIDKIEEAVYWPDGLGPLKVNGTLEITSSPPNEEVTLRLNDTLYITGDTKIYGPTEADPSKLTLDLNGHTIFVASPTAGGHNALEIRKCNIVGSGCIIAVGDVYFAPKGDVGGENDFVLVMSIEGTTTLQPSGTFYGCIAGNLCVDVSSGLNATIINSGLAEGQDLDFPMGVGDDDDELPPVTGVSIESWEVIMLSPEDLGE